MTQLINFAIIALSFVTMFLVVINQPHTDSTFGSKDSFSRTRRGFEKTAHTSTIVSSVLLFLAVLASQILK